MTARDGNDRFLVRTYSWLTMKGFKPAKMPYVCPFDLMVNGKRVEVKEAKPVVKNKKYLYTSWQANIQIGRAHV